MDEPQVIIEVIGEGKTDVGVVPILIRKLCDQPATMQIKRTPYAALQQLGGRYRKIRFAKRQASISGRHGLVFVVDTEGELLNKVIEELITGRDSCYPELPTAVGVAHPCIEAWLLADPAAVKKGLNLKEKPVFPAEPESLDAPQHDRDENPKTILARCVGPRKALSAKETCAIAEEIRDLTRLESGCPKSFKPFAEEVRTHILPLFHPM